MNNINVSEILGIVIKYVIPIWLFLFSLLIMVRMIIRIMSDDSNKAFYSSNHQEEKEKMLPEDIYLYAIVLIVICWIIFK
jgi:hypothetical protein